MKAERLLQISLAALATLGTLLLGYGQDSIYPPLIASIAAIASVIVTDIYGWIRLNRIFANLAALAAAMLVMGDFFMRDYGPHKLLSIANLLICLQVVLFFQKKNTRIYWQLAVLSLLQVVVAAALSSGSFFGGLLIVYMMIGLTTMALFFIYRVSIRAGGEDQGSDSIFRVRRVVVSSVVGAGEHQKRLLTGVFVRQLVGISAVTIGLAFFLFYISPQFGKTHWHGGAQTSVVGFPEEVSLGHMNQILESDELVLRVSFSDDMSAEPYSIIGQPYMRGRVLSEYYVNDVPLSMENQDAMGETGWRVTPSRRGLSALRMPPAGAEVVLQHVVMEPTKELTLFGVTPAYAFKGSRYDIRYDVGRGEMKRERNQISDDELEESKEFKYSLATTGFRNGWQSPVTPHTNPLVRRFDRDSLFRDLHEQLRFAPKRFPRLKEIADDVIASEGLENASTGDRARALLMHFHAPDRYKYSLDFRSIRRDPNLDPIEDFVANHRTGHCQYFSSALAMMLRSQGIPSRVVVGYRPSDYNSVGNYYLVRQRDAHAWVEAYLSPDEVDSVELGASPPSPSGGWLRLDPTPAFDSNGQNSDSAGFQLLVDQGLDYAQFFWRDYIVGESLGGEQAGGAGNSENDAQDRITATLLSWLSLSEWRNWLNEERVRWISAIAGVICALILGGMFVWRFAQRYGWTALLPGVGNTGADEHDDRPVAFYDRLARILAQHSRDRHPGETQLEYANAVSPSFNAASDRNATSVVQMIVAAYYQVRFGDRELTESQRREIESALSELESATADPS